ncbi:MAG: GAF domain-containing sensor histidine kinase [Acidimicrobiales bacterium]
MVISRQPGEVPPLTGNPTSSVPEADPVASADGTHPVQVINRWWRNLADGAGPATELSDGVNNSLIAVLGVLRWSTVVIGLAWAANEATQGNVPVVITLAVAIFISSWRTVSPIRLGAPGPMPLIKSLGDVAVLALAIGVSEGMSSPFFGTLLVAITIVGLGWGLAAGVVAAGVAVLLSPVASAINPTQELNFPGPLAFMALVAAAALPGIAMERVAEIERRRRALAAQRDRLAEANHLLGTLSELATTLPSSLDLNDVLDATRRQLIDSLEAERVAIVAYEDGAWSPLYLDGIDLAPRVSTDELPSPLFQAATSLELLRIPDLSMICDRAGSGLYTRLVVGNTDVGLLGVENHDPDRYQHADAELLVGMSEVMGLTLANARSFRRLRSLAAAEERSRIARDLHDRLGQYLTYIALELERINSTRDTPSEDLKELHEDVQGAIREFRDSLLELRASVTADRPLRVVLAEVVERFRRRSQVEVELYAPANQERLPALVENELLRIAQEALVNVEKHASASQVQLAWTIGNGQGTLVVQDDGRGFNPTKGIRGSAYGLVGMRERAASVGATLEVSSEPGEGTTITVQTSQMM